MLGCRQDIQFRTYEEVLTAKASSQAAKCRMMVPETASQPVWKSADQFAEVIQAALTSWVAPASAVVIARDPGGNLSNANSSFDVEVDLTGIFGGKLSFKTEGSNGLNPCDGGSNADCFSVFVNNVLIAGLAPQPLSVPNSEKSSHTPIGVDNGIIILTFQADFSSSNESIDASNIKVSTVSEPATIALFGLGLSGLRADPESLNLA